MLASHLTGFRIFWIAYFLPLFYMPLILVAEEYASPLGGLWIGTVSVAAVSESLNRNSSVPQPVASSFNFRIIVHVDNHGVPRLLKEVVVSWSEDEPDNVVESNSLPHSLHADIRSLRGIESERIGLRFSTAAYDFESSALDCLNEVGPTISWSCTISLSVDLPAHPFAHRKHPEHNNLDEQYQLLPPERQEVYEITRQISLALELSTDTMATDIEPTLSGQYNESITGLTAHNIRTTGSVTLIRISSNTKLARS